MARVTQRKKTMNELERAGSNQRFDDRVDINTEISSLEALVLMGRCYRLLRDVKVLFAVKFLLGTIAIFPILLTLRRPDQIGKIAFPRSNSFR